MLDDCHRYKRHSFRDYKPLKYFYSLIFCYFMSRQGAFHLDDSVVSGDRQRRRQVRDDHREPREPLRRRNRFREQWQQQSPQEEYPRIRGIDVSLMLLSRLLWLCFRSFRWTYEGLARTRQLLPIRWIDSFVIIYFIQHHNNRHLPNIDSMDSSFC